MDSRIPKPPPILKPHAERVWVIGLDGATFRVLDVFAARGWMPNLAQLMREGTSASLRSTLPPISAPAWTSFLTGCNPGKHGVYAFRGPMRGGWERPVSNGSAIRVPRIWQFLGLFGLSSGLINVPMTYPVEPLHGYMVSGMLTPDGNVAVAYPEDVQQLLRAQKYVVDLHIGRRERDLRTEEQVIDLVNDLVATVQGRTRAALQLLEQRPTTFFTLVFVATDRIQHYAWRQVEQLVQEPEAAQQDRVCQRVLGLYRAVDQALGELLALRDERTAVIVMSDHGFCGLHTRVHLNEWLAQRGQLEFREGARAARQHAKRTRYWLKQLLPRRLLLWGRQTLTVRHTLKWPHTLAYSGDASENAVRINVLGREPEGVVVAGEPYREVRSEIIAALNGLHDPRCGRLVIERAHEREAIYQGPFLDLAPDIVLEPAEGYEFIPEVAYEGDVFVDVQSEGKGIHAQPGVLIAAGAGVRQARDRGEGEIVDVAPTVLYLLGLPVPSEMDGRVLAQALSPDWLAARPPRREPLAGLVPVRDTPADEAYTSEEQRLLEERLSDLGYLE
jgi:predicted AlkP superfamily phosphohydrolase/phosphomutase